MSLWVCSKWNENPTDAEKWEVKEDDSFGGGWWVSMENKRHIAYRLPKSDYRPCEPPAPPERWEDISAECEVSSAISTADTDRFSIVHKPTDSCWFDIFHHAHTNSYRLRKVQLLKGCYDEHNYPGDPTVPQWAFVVEKKVTT